MTTLTARPFHLAVFDVAGTTVLDGDAVLDCLRRAVTARVPVSADDVRAVMGLPKPVAIAELLRAHQVGSPSLAFEVSAIYEAFRADLLRRYRDDPGIVAAPEALQVFQALQQAGICVALDTGFSREILDVLLARLGWEEGEEVDVTVASDEVDRGRPHPDLIQHAMVLADVTNPSRVVKIGDTPADLLEGLSAGCGLVVGVTHGTHTRTELERPGVHIIERLSELLPLVGVRER